ncbi:hypothetical protein H257_01989 [Aphanomyces astaci]|uniref:Uncharacterized protein n=1 Tax=Aphanomyces astaci TaxID=112090 RepID=W4H5V8_APHAT|nr:hypothetical protein H257_01989 [Aphanomyces astaci]ETV86971.1 hypothetical protein H257_01989 [Aphanomyces astaci]|eukprot:XP_009823770.1 hypothetical protein H257_01989 [Aphanomyces astaci]
MPPRKQLRQALIVQANESTVFSSTDTRSCFFKPDRASDKDSSLKRCMYAVAVKVKEAISHELPPRFGLMFDG